MAALRKLIEEIKGEAFKDVPYQTLKLAIRDADAENKVDKYPYMENCLFMNARRPESFGPVPIFNRAAQPIEADPRDSVLGLYHQRAADLLQLQHQRPARYQRWN